jgi:mono/diheme cytochrome c family protein
MHLVKLTVIILSLLPVAAHADSAATERDYLAFGGRLFDMWYEAIDTNFVPDDPETAAIDGLGGPNANGTLNDSDGQPLANNGHDYRLKNLLGWDMRGDAGIYGSAYQGKEFVLPDGPLSPRYASDRRDDWIERLNNGYGGLPAYGEVLDDNQIGALVDYMLAVRDRQLPHPDDLYALSSESAKGFVLAAGGNAARGRDFYQQQCETCHGSDATEIIFDNGEQSLGQHARYYGYAVAMITLAGEPGSDMGPQLEKGLSAAEQTTLLLDLLAALCDRDRYPRGAGTDPDVPDGDLRCREYLR